MDPFDPLREAWQKQPLPPPPALSQIRESAEKHLVHQQRRLVFSNLGVSVAFAGVFLVMAWVWTSFPGRSAYFYGSLAAMSVLLTATLAGLWAGVHYRNIDPDTDPLRYIAYSKKKLAVRRWMLLRFMPWYMFLLLAMMFLYYADVLAGADLVFKASAYGITLLYFVLVWLLSAKKRKRKRAEAEALDKYLAEWENSLKEG